MSLDYPLYEEMVRRKSRGRWFWMIGDRLYYLGLLGMVISPAFLAAFLYIKHVKKPGVPDPLTSAGIIAALSFCVFQLGCWLKGFSYSIAKKEGIDVSRY